jgi:hypothetical protein
MIADKVYMTLVRLLKLHSLSLFLPILGLLTACNVTEITGKNQRAAVIINDGSLDNKAWVYEDSPFYVAGPTYGPSNMNVAKLLSPQAKLITNNTNLTGNCSITFFLYAVAIDEPCIKSLSKSTDSQVTPRKADRTYIFNAESPEFYQTNTLYHLSKGTTDFFKKLSFAYEQIHLMPSNVPKSLPSYLVNSKLFWFKSMASPDKKLFRNDFLTSYAQCELDKNASFSPAGPSLCFGGISEIPGFYFVQDPDIIYHELGHALVSVMMNTRNGFSSSEYHPFRSNLGSYGYDEAGSINEGIADYITYSLTFKKNKPERRIGEFALGRTSNQARPVSEADSMHITGIEETSTGRLSYPHYLLYDPNNPDSINEDVHYAGQIVTHYLVALTKNFKSKCSLPADGDEAHSKASSYVMLLLAETLSELGDLNAKGVDMAGYPYSDPNVFFNNLDKTNSYLWTQVINQVTYRRFFQVFGKNINRYITASICPSFDKNVSERLLDDYGLLLFKTYNNNGNSTKTRSIDYGWVNSNLAGQPLTKVSENNRRKSVLVSKELLTLAEKTDENPNRVGFYIIDNSSDMKALLEELLFKGFSVPLSSEVASTVYNNNNIKVSPGEVIGIIPNLLNKSNSPMAGIQLIAADWDHVDVPTDQLSTGNFKPCVFDSATTVDQGGEAGNTCTTTYTEYNRLIKNPATGLFPAQAVAPVCMVQLEEGDSSRWVSQNVYRKKQGLALMDKDCLGYSTTGNTDPDFSFNPHECLVRFLPGANDAFFSKIDAQKSYYETVVKETSDGTFNSGNLMIMEVNKWIPPGTKFRCRLRARFSNCSDCYSDPANNDDDYIDAELNGNKPFKVINFDFDVND